MRFMVNFWIPSSDGNELVKTGKIGQVFQSLMDDFKPEAAYFFPDEGVRSGFMILSVGAQSELIKISESFWFGLRAEITVTPVMSGEDLEKGLAGIEDLLERYA
jgi:hypothetical protein